MFKFLRSPFVIDSLDRQGIIKARGKNYLLIKFERYEREFFFGKQLNSLTPIMAK